MPLIVDGAYRGAHACHVHQNQKLGKHRTVIKSALPLMSWLIDDDTVASVSLGRLTHASGTKFEPEVKWQVADRLITVLLVDKVSAQAIRLWVKQPTHAEAVVAKIKSKWQTDVIGGSPLKVVGAT